MTVITSTSSPSRAKSLSVRSNGSEKAGCLAALLLLLLVVLAAGVVVVVVVETPGPVKGEMQLEAAAPSGVGFSLLKEWV